ncbi:hypothetical protein ACLOJK_011563 [Asimina triloba]
MHLKSLLIVNQRLPDAYAFGSDLTTSHHRRCGADAELLRGKKARYDIQLEALVHMKVRVQASNLASYRTHLNCINNIMYIVDACGRKELSDGARQENTTSIIPQLASSCARSTHPRSLPSEFNLHGHAKKDHKMEIVAESATIHPMPVCSYRALTSDRSHRGECCDRTWETRTEEPGQHTCSLLGVWPAMILPSYWCESACSSQIQAPGHDSLAEPLTLVRSEIVRPISHEICYFYNVVGALLKETLLDSQALSISIEAISMGSAGESVAAGERKDIP